MNKRRAFTLVELLVVVAIIGILSSLVTVGVMSAVRAAKQARIKMQMAQIELAIEQYKNKYGEYPPDWSDQKAVLRHIKKRWPRFAFTTTTDSDQYREFCSLLFYATGWNPRGTDTAYRPEYMAFVGSLPFWLGGLPDDAKGIRCYDPTNTDPNKRYYYVKNDGTQGLAVKIDLSAGTNDPGWNNKDLSSLIGFSSNPENPFDVGTQSNRPTMEKPLIELEVGKNLAILVLDPTPDNINGTGCTPMIFVDNGPIVYFKAVATQEGYVYSVAASGAYRNYHNLFNTGDYGYRFKSLWNNDHYNDTKDGFAYRFTRGTMNTGLTRFYPGTISPYLQKGNYTTANNTNNAYFNPKTYQLIHPGLDGKFGRWSPTGSGTTELPYGGTPIGGLGRSAVLTGPNGGDGVTQFDLDNIVNFGDGATIKALLP